MGGKRILVVEDERIVAEDLKETLEHLGYEVPAITPRGDAVVELARSHRPDLVLMDIVLKGQMNGVDAAADVRRSLDIPVVYLTAYADETTVERAKRTEPYGYLTKPFDEQGLVTAIEMALYKHDMERKLRLSERWLSTTLRSIGDAVIATDDQGDVRFLNTVAEELTGWSEAEAVGRPLTEVFDIVNEDTGARAENPVARALREGIVVGLANHTALISRDGTETPIADSAAPIRDDDSEIHGVVMVFRDVTQQRQQEREMRRMAKLESVGLLAGGIAHDFNNILTSVIGNVSCAKLPGMSPVERDEVLTEAEQAVWRARDLTQQLLTFASGGVPVKEVASLAELVEEAAGFALRGSSARCDLAPPDDLWPVEVDTGQFNQVFHNLMINADQAMPDGGTVAVELANVELGHDNERSLPRGRYVQVTVSDEGIGIAADHLSRVFDPYFTTKHRGSGLGLAVCHSVIAHHGGALRVESELGVGTTFHVLIPATAARATHATKIGEGLAQGQGRILVMDDDGAVNALVNRMLVRLGYEVVTSFDGAEAAGLFEAAAAAGKPFDVVLLDLTVPGGIGGRETLELLLEIDPGVRAVVCSGYSQDPVLADPTRYGFAAAVVKPFRVQTLAQIIQDVNERPR